MDQELDEYIHCLCDRDQTLQSSIATFLNLPEVATDGHRSMDSDGVDLNQGYAETGRPRTHPSAGLSYLRTGAILTNDPLRGPLEGSPPVEACVIRPMHSTSGQKITQFLSVASIISDNIMSAMGSKSKMSPIDPDVHGGQKMWPGLAGPLSSHHHLYTIRTLTRTVSPGGREQENEEQQQQQQQQLQEEGEGRRSDHVCLRDSWAPPSA
ncbi:MAG: hypothetical protein M1815_000180 [Lichina confinis]|nr:MAG: hypothetical protein M1815_000180 [Lichina confinis]